MGQKKKIDYVGGWLFFLQQSNWIPNVELYYFIHEKLEYNIKEAGLRNWWILLKSLLLK